jgi:hypothetical protein
VTWTWAWPWEWRVYAWDDEAGDFVVSRPDPRSYWSAEWCDFGDVVYARLLGLEVTWLRK